MSKCILLADDSRAVRMVVRSYLESQLDFEVCEAADGVEAIEKTKELSPDLVVMDMSMPNLNGLDAARLLKQTKPQLPIILFTLYKDILQDTDLKSAGVNAVISKSDYLGTLKTEILNLLEPE